MRRTVAAWRPTFASSAWSAGCFSPSSIRARSTICRLTGSFSEIVARPAKPRPRSTSSCGSTMSTRVSLSNMDRSSLPDIYIIYQKYKFRGGGSGTRSGGEGRAEDRRSARGEHLEVLPRAEDPLEVVGMILVEQIARLRRHLARGQGAEGAGERVGLDPEDPDLPAAVVAHDAVAGRVHRAGRVRSGSERSATGRSD